MKLHIEELRDSCRGTWGKSAPWRENLF